MCETPRLAGEEMCKFNSYEGKLVAILSIDNANGGERHNRRVESCIVRGEGNKGLSFTASGRNFP